MKSWKDVCKRRIPALIPATALLFSLNSPVYGGWTIETLTAPQNTNMWQLRGLSFASATDGWAIGQNYRKNFNTEGALFHYQNGSWTTVNPPDLGLSDWWLNGVSFTSAANGWAVGKDDSDSKWLVLHYSGGAWSSDGTIPTVIGELKAVHFTSATEGWAVGEDRGNSRGGLLHYKDGSWTSVAPPFDTIKTLNAVHFTSAGEGWAVGYGPSLLHYTTADGWKSVAPPTVTGQYWYLNSVHFTSAGEGWAVGTSHIYSDTGGYNQGVILHYSSSSGWTPVTPPSVSTSWNLTGVHFTSATEGWAAGADETNKIGVLLHYKNGTWSSVTPPDVEQLNYSWDLRGGVSFASSSEGWAAGYNGAGVLLHYTNTALPTLSVTRAGSGSGTVTSTPAGINCGATCEATFKKGTKVSLTPAPADGSVFTGWSGDCSGAKKCSVAMKADKSVSVGFDTGSCSYTISPSAKNLTYKGGTVTVRVTAGTYTYCNAPEIVNNTGWITAVNSFANDRGTIKLTVPALDSSTGRSGTLTIGGKTFTLTQSGKLCSLSINPSSSGNLGSGQMSGSFGVHATPSDCAWNAESSVPGWLFITSGSSGTGDGIVNMTVSANTTGKPRSGKVTVTLTANKKKKVYSVKQKK